MTISGTWQVAIDEYLGWLASDGCLDTTITTRRHQLGLIAGRLGGDPFDVDPLALRAWFEHARRTWSRDTARGRRSALRGFYGWAIAHDRMAGPSPALAIPRIRPAVPRPRPVPDEVWAPALAVADARELLALDLTGNHGLRRCEVVMVHPERDLIADLTGWSLMVHGKGGKDRIVPLTEECTRRLRELGPGWAFPGAVDGHLSARWMGTLINRLLAQGYTIHKLRHRAGSRWSRQGGDMRVVADLLGHGSVTTTMVYTDVDDGEKRDLVRRSAA